jgi:hypothetical protein
LNPDPFFRVGFRRPGVTKEEKTSLETGGFLALTGTNITWGGGAWNLRIPIKGKPMLYRNSNLYPHHPAWLYGTGSLIHCPWTSGELSEVNVNTSDRGGHNYAIGVIGKAICVSEAGDFSDNFAYYLTDLDEPIVPRGPLTVTSWPGNCTYWIDLTEFPEDMYMMRYPWEMGAGFDTTRQTVCTWGQPYSTLISNPGGPIEPTESLPGVTGNYVDVTLYQRAGYPAQVYYYLRFIRGEFANLNMPLYTTPFLEAVSTQQDPKLTDNGEPTFTETPLAQQGLSLDAQLVGSTSQHYKLKVSNFLQHNPPPEGEPEPSGGWSASRDFQPGRVVKVEGGWIYKILDDDSHNTWTTGLGQYTIIDGERGRVSAEFNMTDLLGLLHLIQWECNELNLRGFYVSDALSFMCDMAGIGPAWYDFEDLEEYSYISNSDDTASWKHQSVYADVMKEVARKYGKGSVLFYDHLENKLKTGCPFCRSKRTKTTWGLHQDAGWNSSGCLAADVIRAGNVNGIDVTLVDEHEVATDPASMDMSLDLKTSFGGLKKDSYANRIWVLGKKNDGSDRLLSASWRNDVALYPAIDGTYPEAHVGFVVDHSIEDSKLTTQEMVNERKTQLVRSMSTWPLMLEGTIPWYPSMRPGWVIKIEGGRYAQANGRKFRVLSVKQEPATMRTRIEARYMTDLDTPPA